MSNKLKETLETDLPGKVSVDVVPVDSSDGKPKVYRITVDGETYYDWEVAGGPPAVKTAPSDQWKTPINFETHEKYFGPGVGQEGGAAKQEMYDTLKKHVESKAS
eukprot:TRINITY_DN67626_c0_g1_i1.p1 TRINITY_DN67626_c0_g1~~TRINITY_DN67626_c0_g1_i1.p1  ORF type:complete len:105 (-),score=29.35 TRINITY_DN67626_c0_g1_i1:281-595(-)